MSTRFQAPWIHNSTLNKHSFRCHTFHCNAPFTFTLFPVNTPASLSSCRRSIYTNPVSSLIASHFHFCHWFSLFAVHKNRSMSVTVHMPLAHAGSDLGQGEEDQTGGVLSFRDVTQSAEGVLCTAWPQLRHRHLHQRIERQ